MGEVEGEEECRKRRRPVCREIGSRMISMGMNPGSRGRFNKSRLGESGGRRWIG